MASPFETLLTLIPIALIIAARIYASKKKNAEAAERRKLAAVLEKSRAMEPVFDAHNLVPDDDERPIRRVERVPEAAPVSHSVLVDPSAQSPQMATPIYSASPPSGAPRPVRATDTAQSATSFFSRLDKLSPLKRAVVMAEILGPPKGR